MDALVKALIAAAGVVIAYFIADKVVEQKTGRHIHDYVFEWWCKLRDKVVEWMQNHPEIPLLGVVGRFIEKADNYACKAKKKMDGIFKVKAIDTSKKAHHITEVVLTREEAEEAFPELKSKTFVVLTDRL